MYIKYNIRPQTGSEVSIYSIIMSISGRSGVSVKTDELLTVHLASKNESVVCNEQIVYSIDFYR